VRKGHVVGCLIAGITNHQTLISGSDLLVLFILMHTLSNLGWLLVNGNDYSCSFIIHSDFICIVSNFLNCFSCNLFEVNISSCANLSKNHANWVFDSTLARNFSVRILFETGIKYRVWDIVTEFVGVACGDVFWCKQEMSWLWSKLLAFHKIYW
jgi:hypothetical protein